MDLFSTISADSEHFGKKMPKNAHFSNNFSLCSNFKDYFLLEIKCSATKNDPNDSTYQLSTRKSIRLTSGNVGVHSGCNWPVGKMAFFSLHFWTFVRNLTKMGLYLEERKANWLYFIHKTNLNNVSSVLNQSHYTSVSYFWPKIWVIFWLHFFA